MLNLPLMSRSGALKITVICAIILSLFTASCNNAEADKNPTADSLRNVNGELSAQLNEKEAAMQEFVASFNEIQENLNTIKEKEKIVTNSTSQGDVRSRQNQIREDIQAIYDLMEKNKNRIGALSEKLKNSNLKISGMQKMIENLQAALNLKDEEINELKNRIEGLNIELSNLSTNYKSLEEESASRMEALNTAYYAIGTSKELKEKKVIAKEGGFIGLGKSTKMTEDFNKEYFTKINIEKSTSINIGSRKAKLVTNHPRNSYKLVGEKPVERLEITNPREFWSSSKYLVIVIE
jgi:chromosome segregation ATPase